jgi:predicted RNase H-like HicB family nuclease
VLKIESNYSAVIRKDGKWWIGWIDTAPGLNSQGRTQHELVENLKSALKETREMDCAR